MADGYEHTLKIASKNMILPAYVFTMPARKNARPGAGTMTDAETGETLLVNTGSKKVRLEYEKYYQAKLKYFQETFNRCGAGVVSTRTDESYVTKLLGYFKARA
jgi:hypothetical protein